MDTISCLLLLYPLRNGLLDVVRDVIQRLRRIDGTNSAILCRQLKIARTGAVKEIKGLLFNAVQLAARARLRPTSGVTSR